MTWAAHAAHEDISDALLECQAGGPLLQQETTPWRQVRVAPRCAGLLKLLTVRHGAQPRFQLKNKKRSTAALLACLQRNKLIFPLFVLIAQTKRYAPHARVLAPCDAMAHRAILFKLDTTEVRLIGELYDKCQACARLTSAPATHPRACGSSAPSSAHRAR
jgi:hypothetical protein